MKTVKIIPAPLGGEINIPGSKSIGHRQLICAGLADGVSIIEKVTISEDIEATIRALRAFGISVKKISADSNGQSVIRISGKGTLQSGHKVIDAGESGSTLRFMIPLAAICRGPVTFVGKGNLAMRPLIAYYDIFDEQGVPYVTTNGMLPLTINGNIKAGLYRLPGNISSQFISGLLMALPLLDKDSVIEITKPLESKDYVSMTVSEMARFGVTVKNNEFMRFTVPGRQKYMHCNCSVEGDYSQAAFWFAAGITGRGCTCYGLRRDSTQADRYVTDILKNMGAQFEIEDNAIRVLSSDTHGITIDGSQYPDIVPVVAALASVSSGTTQIINAGRLRFKESDRLKAMTTELSKIGASVKELPDGMVINGRQTLDGGIVESWNDHRIVMSLAAISSRCASPLVIKGGDCVAKSYPNFWKDFTACGGKIETISEVEQEWERSGAKISLSQYSANLTGRLSELL